MGKDRPCAALAAFSLGAWFLVTPALGAFDSNDVPEAGTPLKILRITPKGQDVPAGRQIVIQFDRNVVPVGRMDRPASEIPVTIEPPLDCEWRWLNTSALACQLGEQEKMKKATRYSLTVEPGIETESGVGMAEPVQHNFVTRRPKVTYSRFFNWLSPGKPLLQVTLNQAVTKSSLEASMHLRLHGQPVRTALNAYPDELRRALPDWMQYIIDEAQPLPDAQAKLLDVEQARRVWLVVPDEELPLDTTIDLWVLPGLVSSEGKEPGIELRKVVSFDTFPEFRLLGIRCTRYGKNGWKNIPSSQLEADLADPSAEELEQRAAEGCNPLNRIALAFSSPVRNTAVRDHVTLTPPLDGGREDYDPWENVRDRTRLSYPHRRGRQYHVWLPERLQAHERYLVEVDTDKLTDEFGRRLDRRTRLAFYTSHREPDLRLTHSRAVLEKSVDTDVPLYVTNLERIEVPYQRITVDERQGHLQHTLTTPDSQDVAFAFPMRARKLLGGTSGAAYGHLQPEPRPPGRWRDADFFVQITPFQVHAKFGHYNSTVWITDMASGEPVQGAKVALVKGAYHELTSLENYGHEWSTNEQGLALLPGIVDIDPELSKFRHWLNDRQERFFVRVEKDKDMALVPLDRYFRTHSQGAYPRTQKQNGHVHSWGTTAQGIYKLGDEVDYKIYVRDQSNEHWVSPRRSGYSLKVYDPQNKIVHQREGVTLSKFGAFDGRFKVPEQGAVGWYRFVVSADFTKFTWQPVTVLISDFTPAPFKVSSDLNGDRFKGGDNVVVSTLATLHSGGPFTQAEARVTARLKVSAFSTNNPQARGFYFGGANEQRLKAQQRNLLDVRGRLDEKGELREAFSLPETDIYYGELMVESAVKDDRGKFVAAAARAEYAGRDRFVGLRNTRWLYETDKPAKLEALVVDSEGQLVKNVSVHIDIRRREFKVARVKGPGNAYLTQNIAEWVSVGSCRTVSEDHSVGCTFTPERAGRYRFIAAIKDSRGREHKTTLQGWVTGSGYVSWHQRNDATLQIVAEQSEYRIGDTARYLIQNPFPGARALITVERYGILDQWVQTLHGSTPVIEVPVKADYLPGFYVSVVAVSPRADKPLGPGNVDLGKPTYRMGYVSARVVDPHKRLAVEVETDKEVYRPRETVKARLHVAPRKRGDDRAVEVAVAVVDESVLALNRSGEDYYDPYAGFNRLDRLDVLNYNLISRLVGRQKFEKKGASPGGGGGESASTPLRNLFKFISYWNPSIRPDGQGNAGVEFEVPDNLTGWRIFALAVTPEDRMGLGQHNIKVNRPTELRPVMPNQVIAGDRFKAGFNIMNRTDRHREISIDVRINGPLAEDAQDHHSVVLPLEPYARRNIWLPVQTKGNGEMSFLVRAGDARDTDALEHSLMVNKRRSLETGATYGTTTQAEINESVHIPEGIYTDVGGVSVALSPSVIGNIDGAFEYIKEYPHLCWEQRLTKATMASSYLQLKDYFEGDFHWPQAGNVVEAQLEAAANFQAPNGGMTYWIPSNRNVSPYLSAYTAVAFNWLRRDGYAVPPEVEARLHDYLLKLLRQDVFPTFYSSGMSSSVRAVALAALAEHGKVDSGDISRYAPHTPEMDLFGKAHFLQAAVNSGGGKVIIRNTIDTILGHASQSGGKFQFNEAWDDSYKYLLATPLRSNCAVLSGLLTAQRHAGAGRRIADIPFKMVRSITQGRGDRNHWENTQENVFCLNALIDYSRLYEAEDPNMRLDVSFDGRVMGTASFRQKSDPAQTLERPMQDGDAGKRSKVRITSSGQGRVYYSVRVAFDLKEDRRSRINSGIEVRREYSVERDGNWTMLESPMEIQRGELVRVDLFVSVPTARHFVVVNDPVPGGLEPVNTDLATASTVDAQKGTFKASDGSWWFRFSDWTAFGRYFWSFYHKELRHDSALFYADYLPAGRYHLSYTAQAIAEGDFTVMPAHAEEMYDPDVYGRGLAARLQVEGGGD